MQLPRLCYAALCIVIMSACCNFGKESLTQYVDPTIGTGEHGHVFLGANVPFGLVQAGPTTGVHGWDHCSGYHADDTTIIGFAHMHLSGTGCGDLGDIALLPITSREDTHVDFSHSQETVRPGYYSVNLESPSVCVELSATQRAAIHRYTSNEPLIFRLDLAQGVHEDVSRVESDVIQTDPCTLSGYRISHSWANNQQVYFRMAFSRPVAMQKENRYVNILTADFSSEPLLVKVGISAVSEENAALNLEAEIPDWDFDSVANQALEAWEKELSRIKIKSKDRTVLRNFYTALYHTMTAPSVFCDVNGEYRGADGRVHTADGMIYTTLSLWDTYRTLHPLMTLIHPDKMEDLCRTMIAIFKEQGRLPIWHLMGCETDCMPGNSAIPVLGDMIVKGLITDRSLRESAYEAMKTSSMTELRSLDNLRADGFLATNKNHESVARALEYCIDDDAVYQVAKMLGREEDADYFYRFSRTYSKYFDSCNGFMRGIDDNGHFRTPFTPIKPMSDYTEGNAWQYTFLVPHDPEGLIGLFGRERFIQKLDSLFIVQGELGEEAPPDISGLIGQYAHGNEPSHHIIYLYDYAGEPRKAAPLLRQVMTQLYQDIPGGLCGNEDVGQMSAWYVMSALGLYQVSPCGGDIVFGSPMVDEAVLQVGEGREFRITVHNNCAGNIYVTRAALNGKTLENNRLTFKDIHSGGHLEFWMGK